MSPLTNQTLATVSTPLATRGQQSKSSWIPRPAGGDVRCSPLFSCLEDPTSWRHPLTETADVRLSYQQGNNRLIYQCNTWITMQIRKIKVYDANT